MEKWTLKRVQGDGFRIVMSFDCSRQPPCLCERRNSTCMKGGTPTPIPDTCPRAGGDQGRGAHYLYVFASLRITVTVHLIRHYGDSALNSQHQVVLGQHP